MSKTTLKKLMESMGPALRTNRMRVASVVLQNPSLFPDLLELSFETSYKLHHKAAWTLELLLERKLHWLLPHIDSFTQNIHKLKHEGAIRPVSKICKWLAESYVKKSILEFQEHIKIENVTQIIETGFDWMITDTKVATKAYTMDTLYYFGSLSNEDFEWIHTELKNIIIQNSNRESSAYKAHARQILKLLN